MAGNINQVSFTNPLDPGYAIQAQVLERQQAIADALRQQSMQPVDAGKGAISWTQGLGKLAQALSARVSQKRLDSKGYDLAVQSANASRAMFDPTGTRLPQIDASHNPYQFQGGLGDGIRRFFGIGQDGHVSTASDAGGLTNAPQSSPVNPAPIPMQAAPQMRSQPPQSPPVDPSQDISGAIAGLDQQAQAAGIPPSPDPSAQSPQPLPPAAPPVQQEPAATAPSGRGPLSLTGDPVKDYVLSRVAGEDYYKGLVSANSPTDVAKNLMAQGYQPGTPEFAQAMAHYNAKQSFIEPTNVRQGGIVLDPITHQPVFQAVKSPDGSYVNYGPDGKPTSIAQVPGGAQAEQAITAAHATGQAAGDAVQVFDPSTGQMKFVPKSAVLGGGFAAAPPPGFASASDVTGKNSAAEFNTISNGASDVPNRLYALSQMEAIAKDPKSILGPGSPTVNHFAGFMNTIGIPIKPDGVTNAQEFGKWANQYSARSAQELGLSGSDARVQIAIHATPNGEMNAPALLAIIPQMRGLENAKAGYATAANAWQQAHGPQTVQQFRTEWNRVYDPKVYTLMAQGPQVFAATVARMPRAEAAALRNKYIALKQIGALPQ